MNGIVEEPTLLENETITLGQIRQKFVELGAKKVDSIEKKKGFIVSATLELWRTLDEDGKIENEVILWIYRDGTFKVFNMLNSEDYE